MSETMTNESAEKLMSGMDGIISSQIVMNPHEAEAIVAILGADGNVLFTGDPGSGKTALARTIASMLGSKHGRVQGGSDTMPSDIVGSEIYNPQTGQFNIQYGPAVQPVVLVDEIARIPSKAQSGLLERMEESQITVGNTTKKIPNGIVLATMNPTEHDDTVYELANAVSDRIVASVSPERLTPSQLVLMNKLVKPPVKDLTTVLNTSKLDSLGVLNVLRAHVKNVPIESQAEIYLAQNLVELKDLADKKDSKVAEFIGLNRTMINAARLAKSFAVLEGKGIAGKEEIRRALPLVLGHRLIMRNQRGSDKVTPVDFVNEFFSKK